MVWGWCLDAVCLHLEAVAEGKIRRLLINIPPGHLKSMLCSVIWPAWMWLRDPGWRLFSASYAYALALRDSVKSRELLQSDWYREMFDPEWTFSDDQNAKGFYRNSERGERFTSSVDSAVTGFRGDCVLVDDPMNALDALSSIEREKTNEWWRGSASNRLNDMVKGAHVLIGQRLHHQDLFDWLIKRGGYEHLNLPSEFEADRRCSTSLWTDPRTADGELLFPERFPPSVIADAKIDLRAYNYSAQHQQRPTPRDGGIFRRDWLPVEPKGPLRIIRKVRAWDLAESENKGDWTVGVLLGEDEASRIWILDVRRFRLSTGERDLEIKRTAESDGRLVPVRIEQMPGGGKSEIFAIGRLLRGHDFLGRRPEQNKEVRARPFASACERGQVRLVEASWNEDYIEELCLFPGGHDDQVDGSSLGYNQLMLLGLGDNEEPEAMVI